MHVGRGFRSLSRPLSTSSCDASKTCPLSDTLPREMDYIFTPWRYTYITGAGGAKTCVFCDALASKNDRQAWIVYRGRYTFVILNAFPYTSGHVMIVPYEHVDELQKLPSEAAHEMIDLSQKMECVLREVYHPE